MTPLEALVGWKLKLAIGGAVLLMMCGVFAFFHHMGVQAQVKKDAPVIAKLQHDVWQCQTNYSNIKAAKDEQNAAVEALKAESDARIADISKQLSAAKKTTMKAEAAAAYVRAHPPQGLDVCARMLDVDETFLKALQ